MFVNPQWNVVSREGWKDVKNVQCAGKAGTVVFDRPFAAWESLVSGGAYAAHVIRGKNMNQQFNDSIPVSSGPWKFQSWQRGVQLTLVKNPRYRAGPPMKLDRVVFRFIVDTNARFQALEAGEGHVMEPQPQLQIADFLNDSDFRVQRSPEYAYEHIDIQQGPRGHPALRLPYVRQALITGIDRREISRGLFRTIAPGLPNLDSLVFKTFERGLYKPNFRKWRHNPQKVISTLRGKGCTGGPSSPSDGNTDIFTCPGVGRLVFRFFTTTGNQLRTLAFELIEQQLKSVGIGLIPRFQTAGQLFGSTLPSGRLGPDDVHVRRRARLEDHEQHALLLRRRPELRQLLQPEGDRRLQRGHARARHREAERAPEPGRRAARGRPPLDPALRAAEVGHQREGALRPGAQHDERGHPLERRRLAAEIARPR